MLAILPSIDRHVLAAVSIAGVSLDFLGGMYLAYDLLGGKHGPLRTLTRGVTYGVIFAVGYGIPLGWRFGLATGITHGITLGVEMARASRGLPVLGFIGTLICSAFRGIGFGVGLLHPYGWEFATTFAILSTLGQVVAYYRGRRPGMEYLAMARPRITRLQAIAIVYRTVGYIVAGALCGLIAHSFSFATAMRIGLAIGVATAAGNAAMPYIEWLSETLPERKLGAFGVMLILAGFSLQSLQYWVSLLDVEVR